MFSPEDANIIMRALAEYQKVKDKLNEIEDDKMGIGQEDIDSDSKDESTSSDSENTYHVLKGSFDVSELAENQKEQQKESSEKIEKKSIEDLQKKQEELIDENLTKEKLKEEKIADITEEMIERLLA